MYDSWNSAVLNQGIKKNLDSIVDNLMATANSGSGKNLNSYPYNKTTLTDHNVTFTDNGDGTITATGKSNASVRSGFQCHIRTVGSDYPLFLPNGKYTLTGCPAGGSGTSYYIALARTVGGAATSYGEDYGEGLTFSVQGDDNNTDKAQIQLVIYCSKDYQLPDGGLTFKPMITRFPNTDESWVPYIPTSYEQAATLSSIECKETTAGNYFLQATVDSEGAVTYSWEEVAP